MLAGAVVWSLLPLLVVAQDDQVSYSRRKAKRQRELEAAVAAAIVNTPKADDSHAIDVPYEQHLQHNTGSTYTSSTTHPHRSGNTYGGGPYSSTTGQSHGSGGRHSSSLWDDPVIVAARIPVDRVELGELISRVHDSAVVSIHA
ncbi:hypothetical protein PC119_g23133 [Phytophthora cactorum]|nr:hypothetical protein PC119_g23133 [Phytophthora cactorum]